MKFMFDNFIIIYDEPRQESLLAISDGWDFIRIHKIEDLKKFIEAFQAIKEDLEKGEKNDQ